jgi:hypothetical protein
MRNTMEIENIEDLRRQEGIEDIELQDEIRRLRAGDFIRLTLLDGVKSFHTVVVRITSIKGSNFRGKVAKSPPPATPPPVPVGSPITFTTAHIHSIPKMRQNGKH